MLLYPRLPSANALELIREQADLDLPRLVRVSALEHEQARFNPVGGKRVRAEDLDQLRTRLRELAEAHGFPDPVRGRTGQLDRELARLLYSEMNIVPADAGHEGVWSFLSLVLVPELPVWRFPGRTPERLRGMPRNALRRLWWRAHTFDVDEESPIWNLTEDQLVQIEERPSIGGNPPLARELAAAFLEFSEGLAASLRDELLRDTMKRVVRISSVVSLYHLGIRDLRACVDEGLEASAAALLSRSG